MSFRDAFENFPTDRVENARGVTRMFFDIWRREAPLPTMIRHVLNQSPRFLGAKLSSIHLPEDSGAGGGLTAVLELSESVDVIVAMALDRDGFELVESGCANLTRVGNPSPWPKDVHPAIARLLDQVVHEASRHRAAAIVAMIHSFDPNDGGLQEFKRAAAALGVSGAGPTKLAGPSRVAGVEFFLGWCADRPASEGVVIVNGRKTDSAFFDDD